MKQLSLESLQCVLKASPPLRAAMESAHLPLTAANMVKCNLTPPRLTGREILDDLMSFAKDLPRRLVHPKQDGRKATALPPSVVLPLFDFVERTEANRTFQQDTELTSFTKDTARRKKKITNSVLNRKLYTKKCEEEETKRSVALDVTHYLQDCLQDRELDLLDARLEAAAQEISDYIVESEIDEQMQLLDARLRKAASDIDKHIEEEEKAAERKKQLIEMEARLLKAAGEIEHRLQVLERGLPVSANKAEGATGDED